MSRMTIIPTYLTALKARFGLLNIVETGTIRNTNKDYVEGDGHSTLHIAEWIKHNGGNFTSIDLYTEVAKRYLTSHNLQNFVKFEQGDSRRILAEMTKPLHFVLLDSANDVDVILGEFKLVEPLVVDGGIVMVDDVYMDSVNVVKGHKVIPYAREKYRVYLIGNGLAVIHF